MKDPVGRGSRERMLEAAIALMRESGLSGAGINEVVRLSGAPKGSVYHFFPQGKQQLVAEALALYSGRVQAFIEEALTRGQQPADKLEALFEAFARRVEAGGFQRSCAAGAVCLDLDGGLEDLRRVLGGAFSEWIALIARHLPLADAEQAQSLARLVLTTIEGAYIRCRAEHSGQPFRESGAWLARLVRSCEA